MKKMTKLNLSFTSLAFAVLPLVISGCDQKSPQTDSMTPDSMTATNAPQMMQTNSMNSMAPQTGSMAPNNMAQGMATNTMSGANNMGGSSPSMNSMAAPMMNTNAMNTMSSSPTGSMTPNSMTSTNQM
jgi:hypothetical protein